MKINVEIVCKLVLSFLMAVVRYGQSTQNKVCRIFSMPRGIKFFVLQINIKVCFLDLIDVTFSWSGVLIKLCHGNRDWGFSDNILLFCKNRQCWLL